MFRLLSKPSSGTYKILAEIMPKYSTVIPLPPNVIDISILQYYRVVRDEIRIKNNNTIYLKMYYSVLQLWKEASSVIHGPRGIKSVIKRFKFQQLYVAVLTKMRTAELNYNVLSYCDISAETSHIHWYQPSLQKARVFLVFLVRHSQSIYLGYNAIASIGANIILQKVGYSENPTISASLRRQTVYL
jgi:hypothetical protein